jgi:serine/threonine protein kinase
MQTKQE